RGLLALPAGVRCVAVDRVRGGYATPGVPGAVVACLAAILPPTAIMLGVAVLLQRLRGETWVIAPFQ
ncbi:MAG: chromate transporter, partial [Chloroflexota bacterium]